MIGQSPPTQGGIRQGIYRLKQGLQALFAFAYPLDEDLACQTLTPSQLALFRQLSRSEQLHSLNVLRDVQAQEAETPSSLAVAALMHDIGKSRYRLWIWQKTMAVLVRKIAPQWEQQFSADDRITFWRAPFVVRRHHPRWGYELLAGCGADDRALWLVLHHATPAQAHRGHPYYVDLLRLQQADDAN